MNKKDVKLEQPIESEVQKNEEIIGSKLESETKTKPKSKLEQDQELRDERLNVSGNQRLQREIQKNSIERVTQVKKKPGRKKKTPPLRNAEGIKLKKDGTVDPRSANFYNGPLYKSILARKKENQPTETKKVIYTPIVESDSEDDIDFEITPIETPVVQPNVKQEEEREKQNQVHLEQLKQIEDEKKQLAEQNKKLKDDFYFNSHLNKISLSARNMKLKF